MWAVGAIAMDNIVVDKHSRYHGNESCGSDRGSERTPVPVQPVRVCGSQPTITTMLLVSPAEGRRESLKLLPNLRLATRLYLEYLLESLVPDVHVLLTLFVIGLQKSIDPPL